MEFLPEKTQRIIFKIIQSITNDNLQISKIEEKGFRQRMALLVRDNFINRIDKISLLEEPMKDRLRNLVVRHHGKAIGSNAPICDVCKKHITLEQPFKEHNGEKMHYKCFKIFENLK